MSVALPAGIDAGALLGLAGKVSQVFSSTDLTAVVPMAPCAFDTDRLGRLSAPKTAEDVRLLAEFSQLVSLIPTGPLWVPGAGRPVWEPYLDVLDRAEVATSDPLTAAESERLAKALDYLYDEQDGTRVPSPELVAYRMLRDAWFTAAQEYANRALAADAPSSDDAKKAWQTQEQVLRAIVAERMAQWESDGHKGEIERCQEVERELGSRSASTLFARLNKAVGPREVFSTPTATARASYRHRSGPPARSPAAGR
ncbi:hypothetical protein GCM10020367_69790 [Streptomyces sannanensis]|uniref:Uncharacterized protein n=1 Tax=Streptomyces sannanensis TaxID=285536 RepID=A0ABP6SP09_9ACTN